MPSRTNTQESNAPSLSKIQDAVKSAEKLKKKNPKKTSAAKKTLSSATVAVSGDKNSELLGAIRALGGGDEDFDLVKNLDDASEDDMQEFSDREENVRFPASDFDWSSFQSFNE